MSRRLLLACCAALALVATGAAAAPSARPAPRPGAPAASPAAAARGTKAPLAPRPAPRRLEDIHIEGEIPVPQVLFITARDQRRFMEFQHHRYLKTSLELGRSTATPSQIVVTHPAPAERKENQR